MKVIDLVTRFEKFAPKELSVNNDPIGIQIGSLNQPVSKILVTLDVRPEIVQEAVNNHCDMIFSHHPAMFKPIHNLDLDDSQKRMYADIIKNNITVYSAHTNLDNANGGMNDWLAKQIGLQNIQGLVEQGEYNGHKYFMGRIGNISQTTTVYDFAQKCKEIFNISGLRLISNNINGKVNRVAILGGDGGKFYRVAKQKQADIYITGDVYYHVGHDMLADDISVIDPGHHIESICKPHLVNMFKQWAKELDWPVEIIESQINTDPYQFM